MALTKIDDICLYTALNEDAQECYELKKWLNDNGVSFQGLHYNDDSQLEEVFTALNTWWENANFTKLPILVYTEIHSDLSPMLYPKKFFTTLEEAKASNFLNDYKLGR